MHNHDAGWLAIERIVWLYRFLNGENKRAKYIHIYIDLIKFPYTSTYTRTTLTCNSTFHPDNLFKIPWCVLSCFCICCRHSLTSQHHTHKYFPFFSFWTGKIARVCGVYVHKTCSSLKQFGKTVCISKFLKRIEKKANKKFQVSWTQCLSTCSSLSTES